MKSENPCELDAENSHCMQDPPVQDSVTNSWFRCRPHDPCLVNTPAPGAKILHENINSIQKLNGACVQVWKAVNQKKRTLTSLKSKETRGIFRSIFLISVAVEVKIWLINLHIGAWQHCKS